MNVAQQDIEGISPIDRRWSWMEVDLDAIRFNIIQVKKQLKPNVRFMAVVKADAYGHGAVQIAKTACNCGAAYLGVATIDEAIDLRINGIDANILILSQPPETAIPLLVKYDIMPAVYTPDFAIQYAEAADHAGKSAPYHLAINTGMNRIGVRYNNVVNFLKSISFHRALELVGTFTHFASSDTPEQLDFQKQYTNFKYCLELMKSNDYDPGIVHAANSAAIFRYPETHFDMVRAGVVIYGYNPSETLKPLLDLHPAMSIHARITDERVLGLGEAVSYGQKYRARNAVKICTIPIGYADGLHRCSAGKIGVIYKGRVFPIVGAICMDMCMFEIDMNSAFAQEHFNAQIGEEVILMGQEGQAYITIDDLARACDTINYEVACAFGRRMPVIYK